MTEKPPENGDAEEDASTTSTALPEGADELEEADAPGHVVPEEDLQYPTLDFDDGEIESDGSLELSKDIGRDQMSEWASDLAGALSSHDLGIQTPDQFGIFGIGPDAVAVSFDPDEQLRGTLEITFRLSSKAMLISDAETETVGSRGDKGFVPLSLLTDDDATFRCYSWIDEPDTRE